MLERTTQTSRTKAMQKLGPLTGAIRLLSGGNGEGVAGGTRLAGVPHYERSVVRVGSFGPISIHRLTLR